MRPGRRAVSVNFRSKGYSQSNVDADEPFFRSIMPSAEKFSSSSFSLFSAELPGNPGGKPSD